MGTLYERRQYRHPPIESAVCEFRLTGSDESWSAATPGLYFGQVQGEYPVPPRDRLQLPVELTPGFPNAPQVLFGQVQPGILYTTEDEAKQIILSRDALAVHVRSPYPGWERFYPQMRGAVDAYVASGITRPVGRVGLRYVNKIAFRQPNALLTDYFVNPPTTPDPFPPFLQSVLARWESWYDGNENERMVYTFATNPAEPNFAYGSAVVDLDVIQIFSEPLSIEEAFAAVPEMKRRETAAFEAVITDMLRDEVFDAE